jgi:hypothetical protein
VLTWSRGSIGFVGEVFEVMTQVDLGLTDVSRFDLADSVITVITLIKNLGCRRGKGWVPTSRHLGARGASGQATLGGREPRESARGGAGRSYGAYGAARRARSHSRVERCRLPLFDRVYLPISQLTCTE